MKTDQLYRRHRFPPDVISRFVWLYYRFSLSYRDVELMKAGRGLELTYETIRKWCLKFGTIYAKKLKAKKEWGDQWYRDEVYCRVVRGDGLLWRAVDQQGQTLEILVQRKRNKGAAERLFRKLRKHGDSPRKVVTDKLKRYFQMQNIAERRGE